jgi:hypothetical protein
MSFFRPTVDSVVADFHKVVAKLESVAGYHAEQAATHAAAATESTTLSQVHAGESSRASSIAEKIKALVS